MAVASRMYPLSSLCKYVCAMYRLLLCTRIGGATTPTAFASSASQPNHPSLSPERSQAAAAAVPMKLNTDPTEKGKQKTRDASVKYRSTKKGGLG